MELENIGENPFTAINSMNPFIRASPFERERELLLRDRLFGTRGSTKAKRFNLSEKLASRINEVDHKTVSGLIRLIICAKEIDNFEYEFAAACCVNQQNRERLLSALMFLLVNRNSSQLKESPLVEDVIYSKGYPAITGT